MKATWRSVWGLHGETRDPNVVRSKKADVIIDEIMAIILDDAKLVAGDEVYVLGERSVHAYHYGPTLMLLPSLLDQILNEKASRSIGQMSATWDFDGYGGNVCYVSQVDDEVKRIA